MTKARLLTLFLVLSLLLTSCIDRPVHQDNLEADPAIVAYTSFYPLYDFARKIGGERVEVINLIPGGVEPHDWEPGPQALAALYHADLLIINGLGMEPWVEKVAGSLEGNIKVVVASEGITPITGYSGDSHGHDDCDEDCDHDHEADDHDDHCDEEDEDDEDHIDFPDPHVWLDPQLALHQAEQIAKAFIELDPDHTQFYQENLAEFERQVDALNQEYIEAVKKSNRKEFIVTHLSFGYLAQRYGLIQVGISGLSPHAEPSPKQMKEIVDFVLEKEIRYIFQEPLTTNRLAIVLASETGTQILALNPLEGLSDSELNDGEDYFSVMRKNLDQLKIALAE